MTRLVKTGENWLVGEQVIRNVHPAEDCVAPCTFHSPIRHHMSDWFLLWRGDRGIFERICDHGVGHPDPSQFPYWRARKLTAEAVHGCDGCCIPGLSDNVTLPLQPEQDSTVDDYAEWPDEWRQG